MAGPSDTNHTIHIQQLGHGSSNSKGGGGDGTQVQERSNRQFHSPRYPQLVFPRSLDFFTSGSVLEHIISPRWHFFKMFVLLDLSPVCPLGSFCLLNKWLALRYFYQYDILVRPLRTTAGDATSWCAFLATMTRLVDIPFIIVLVRGKVSTWHSRQQILP